MSKKRIISLIVIGVLLSGISVFATYLIESKDVEFDNTTANIPDGNGDETVSVQEAIDYLINNMSGGVSSYEITYNAQNGESNTTGTSEVIPSSNQYGDLPTPTKSGNIFLGWYDAAEGGNKIASDTVIDENKTVYAHWVEGTGNFSTDSWETIKEVVQAGVAETVYNVGDTRMVTLKGTGDLGKTYMVRLANNSTPSDCFLNAFSQTFSQTACGFVVEFTDIITTYTIGLNYASWSNSQMRSWLNSTFLDALPSDIQDVITETTVLSGTVSGTYSSSQITYYTTTDKLYLLSPKEVLNYEGKYDTAYLNTRQLDYYGENEVSTSNYSGAIKKKGSSASNWWLRTAYSYSTDYVMYISSNGSWNYAKKDSSSGVSPAFRIG